MRATRSLIAGLCLLALGGCESSGRLGDVTQARSEDPAAAMASAEPSSIAADPTVTGSLPAAAPNAAAPASHIAHDEEVERGKKDFGAGRFAVAERHFRRASARQPENAEAWLGLAAVYDEDRRFAAADRAYDKAIELLGSTPEILNNRGYSYMLRGDYPRARQMLLEARAKDPDSPYIKNNLDLLASKLRKAKASAH